MCVSWRAPGFAAPANSRRVTSILLRHGGGGTTFSILMETIILQSSLSSPLLRQETRTRSGVAVMACLPLGAAVASGEVLPAVVAALVVSGLAAFPEASSSRQ